jgi:hypothetical protein
MCMSAPSLNGSGCGAVIPRASTPPKKKKAFISSYILDLYFFITFYSSRIDTKLTADLEWRFWEHELQLSAQQWHWEP